MASNEGTPLAQVTDWPSEHVRKLAAKGINRAEQVVAIGATPGGLDSLAEELGVSAAEARRLVGRARARLSPETAARMEEPVPRHGLGAVRPPPPREGDQGRD